MLCNCDTVLRFTKEEILALRVETKVLASLVELADIVSVAPLPPATSLPFDFEDVSFGNIFDDKLNAPNENSLSF